MPLDFPHRCPLGEQYGYLYFGWRHHAASACGSPARAVKPRSFSSKLIGYGRQFDEDLHHQHRSCAGAYPPGTSFDANAYKRARQADVKRMVAEFRAPVAEKLNITLEWLVEENLLLYRTAKAAGQIRDARECLKELGVLSGIRIERSEYGEPGEFERMSDEEVWKDLTRRASALGFEPPPETQH